jgi:hypothetical protein
MQNLTHNILSVLTAITIVAEVGSIILWVMNPTIPMGQARVTLAIDFRIAVASAAIFATLNSIALFWIIKRKKIGSIFLIGISIINRGISALFFIGGAHLVFITWTILLIIFAYLDYRKLLKIHKQTEISK